MYDYPPEFTQGFWENHAQNGKSFEAVRAGWSEEDCKNRIDETISNSLIFKNSDVVLDLGCGIGYTCKMVSPKVREYIGIDYSPEMIRSASKFNKEFKNTKFITNDGLAIPFDDNYFDVIYSEQIFQHISQENSYSYFKEILRTIKPDGSFFLQIPRFGRPAANGRGMTNEELNRFFDIPDIDAINKGGEHYIYVKHGDRFL